jgi:hypothetical protein
MVQNDLLSVKKVARFQAFCKISPALDIRRKGLLPPAPESMRCSGLLKTLDTPISTTQEKNTYTILLMQTLRNVGKPERCPTHDNSLVDHCVPLA